MTQKTLAIYFSDPEPMGYPFHKEEYFEMYQEIIRAIEKAAIAVFIVRGASYQGKGRFNHGWRFESGELKKSTGPIQADLIFNRDDQNTIPKIYDCPIINHPDFDELCVDKIKTAELFPEFSPRTAGVHSFKEYKKTITDWSLKPDERVVLKLNFETEGRGVHVLPVKKVTEYLYNDWNNILMQEFLDSSVGIPGLTTGLHDLRVTVVNGDPINSYIRIPKPGSFLANISQGGTGQSLGLDAVPKTVLAMVSAITAKVRRYYPLLYAADFMNSPAGFKLIELNSRPGIQHPKWSDTYKKFNDAIVRMLVEALK